MVELGAMVGEGNLGFFFFFWGVLQIMLCRSFRIVNDTR